VAHRATVATAAAATGNAALAVAAARAGRVISVFAPPCLLLARYDLLVKQGEAARVDAFSLTTRAAAAADEEAMRSKLTGTPSKPTRADGAGSALRKKGGKKKSRAGAADVDADESDVEVDEGDMTQAKINKAIDTAVGRALKKQKQGSKQQQRQQQQQPQQQQQQQQQQPVPRKQQNRREGREPGRKLTMDQEPPTGGWTADNLPPKWEAYPPIVAMIKAHKAAFGEPQHLPQGSQGECLGHLYSKCRFGDQCKWFHSDTVLTNEEKATTANAAVRAFEAGE
jgi:hypothetical protein